MKRNMRFHRARPFSVPAASGGTVPRPFCGFYDPVLVRLHAEHAEYWLPQSENTLTLAEVHIGAFRTCEMPASALAALDGALSALSEGRGLILRFVYDWDGDGLSAEPETLRLILRHIAQCGATAAKYAARILVLQGLFIGSWGEMHTSRYLSDDALSALTDAVTAAFPGVPVAVRTPALRERLLTGRISRVGKIGLFNDGILGSETDLGTFSGSRADALTCFAGVSADIPYGGELVAGACFAPRLCRDMLTASGASYLNCGYDEAAIAQLKQTRGKDGSLYDEIAARLGYRMTITGVRVADGGLSVTVKNDGYAKNYKPFALFLHCVTETESRTVPFAAGADEIAAGQQARFCAPLPAVPATLYCTAAVGGMPMPFANQTAPPGVCLGFVR